MFWLDPDQMINKIREEQAAKRAVEEFRAAERAKWIERVKLAIMAIPAILSAIALIRTF